MTVGGWLMPRILELIYTSNDLEPFARDLGYEGPPFRWNPERRFQLRSELDAAIFHLYGVARDDVGYITDTFPLVRSKDERQYARYRTKDAILQEYDRQAEAGAAAAAAADTAPQDIRAGTREGAC